MQANEKTISNALWYSCDSDNNIRKTIWYFDAIIDFLKKGDKRKYPKKWHRGKIEKVMNMEEHIQNFSILNPKALDEEPNFSKFIELFHKFHQNLPKFQA